MGAESSCCSDKNTNKQQDQGSLTKISHSLADGNLNEKDFTKKNIPFQQNDCEDVNPKFKEYYNDLKYKASKISDLEHTYNYFEAIGYENRRFNAFWNDPYCVFNCHMADPKA